jgi:hypothetical protein
MMGMRKIPALMVFGAAFGVAFPGLADSPAGVGFNRDVRPILAEACFHCHGPDPGTREAGLRLDTEAGFFKAEEGGTPPVVKGSPERSELYLRLISKDRDELMPPPEAHKELKPHQIAMIRKWIEEGAPWEAHWSLIAPVRPGLPAVKNPAWCRNEIDRFVLNGLEGAGLQPAPGAGAAVLIRRVALDLTGLPPSPDLLQRYLAKAGGGAMPDAAYDELVEELLASPAYGEHRARYWLDAARYADTHGLHFDKYREMWPYRDWVIRAFNRNQPFDLFTIEQLAGDLLPSPTEEQRIATGFQRCNMTTNEGGTIDEENLANYAADRVQTLGWVYLGLTTNCAQCHDHKFDPITARDYYSISAFFRNTTQQPKDGNVKDGLGPVLVIPEEKDRPRWNALPAEIAAANGKVEERRRLARPEFEKWLLTAKPADLDGDIPSSGLVAHVALDQGAGTGAGPSVTFAGTGAVEWKADGKLGPAAVISAASSFEIGAAGDFEKDQAFSYGAWVRAGSAGISGAILARMDQGAGHRGWDLWQAGNNYAVHLSSSWPGDSLRVVTRRPAVRPGQWQHLFVTYDGSGRASGVRIFLDGEAAEVKVDVDSLKGSIKTGTLTRIGRRSQSQPFEGGSVQDVRIYGRRLEASEVRALAGVVPLRRALAVGNPAGAVKNQLFAHYLATRDESFRAASAASAKLLAEQTAIRDRSPMTHVQQERTDGMAMANILMRGQYDKPGEKVEAAIPVALGKLPQGAPGNRLGLAEWLVGRENPLTARVTVNRMWQELFGRGLVFTAEDFGIMGTPPANPALLDWLAVEFTEKGWDMKNFYRQVVRSSTYRQAAIVTPEKLEKDRDNALLSRGPRFRMDAEMLRDYALAASGTLSSRRGGPGTKPYQPENVWEVVGMGTERYQADKGENLYRRTVYNFWKRMAPPANMEIFNAPSREVCTVRRDRTNTPLQALVTMNDPQFVEAARNLAQAAMRGAVADGGRLGMIGDRLLCRPWRAEELAILTASLDGLRTHYEAQPSEAAALLKVGESPADPALPSPELAAWTMVCNQVMNLDEVLNK